MAIRLKSLTPAMLAALAADQRPKAKPAKLPQSTPKSRRSNDGTEHALQLQIIEWLKLNGFPTIRINSGATVVPLPGAKRRFIKFNDAPGCSDILTCVNGFFVAVEVKRPGWKPHGKKDRERLALQEAFIADIVKAGGKGLVADSLEKVIDFVTGIRGLR